MTAFQTDAGLVRYCTMVMGATNSVAAFLRIIHKIIYRHCMVLTFLQPLTDTHY
jgi:hypothetical protein